ncbi:MAG: VWA domain-containing protein [Phycisphaerales bacterium]
MTLLAPFAGFLAGVLGLLGLLALHSLKLRRRPIRVSSTLLWKDAAQDLEVNTPWRRPRLTWLFLLQALAVMLLALSIARPVTGPDDRPAERIVFVIDASASMNALIDGKSNFERVVEAAAERIDALRRSDTAPEIAVIRAANRATLALAPTRSLGDARSAITRVTPSDQAGNPVALRELIASMLQVEATDESSPKVSVWCFTDGGSFNATNLNGIPGEIVSVADDAPPMNAGIASAHASRDPDDPKLARVFVRLVSNAPRPVGVILNVRSSTTEQRVPIEIPAATDDSPGSITRTVPIQAPDAAMLEVTLASGGGALVADDSAWIELPNPSPPRTVVFAPGGVGDPFLLNVLNELAPGAVSVHDLVQTDALRGAALAIYDRVSPTVLPDIPTLGFGSAWPAANEQADGDDPDGLIRNGRERVIAWDRAHPVLRGTSLSSIVFDRAVALPDADATGVRVLAESNRGPVITETTGQGVRHIRVAFPLVRSNWSLEVGMPIFLAGVFEYLAPGTRGEGIARRTDEVIQVRASGERVLASGPAEFAATASINGQASIGPLERIGIYQVENAQPARLAVSLLDADESSLSISENAQLGPTGGKAITAGSGRRELWPIALIAAVVVMTIEYLLHAARARI